MNALFERILSRYQIKDMRDRQNAVYEIAQIVALAGLNRGGFFDHAAFYGGTCLRLFHQLPRFSEDMDFSLLRREGEFKFRIISSLSSTSFITSAGMLRLAKRVLREFVWKVIL